MNEKEKTQCACCVSSADLRAYNSAPASTRISPTPFICDVLIPCRQDEAHIVGSLDVF